VKQFAVEFEAGADELVRALLSLSPTRNVCILDSCGARPPDARYLIAGFDPVEIIEANRFEVVSLLPAGKRAVHQDQSILDILDSRLNSIGPIIDVPENDLPAYGACIASFAYEFCGKPWRPYPATSNSIEDNKPAVRLAFFESLIVHDYSTGKSFVTSSTEAAALHNAKQQLAEILSQPVDPKVSGTRLIVPKQALVKSNFTRASYIQAVDRIKEHIAAGDIYQANLTQQLTVELDQHQTPENVFLKLRSNNPASFSAFLRAGEESIVSASPERFIRVTGIEGGRTVEAWPIKGTRRRGASPKEDAALRKELFHSAKDRAENVMIVDLMRNDLGRVCRYGSVEVPELFTVQEHPTLFHLVSKVRGVLNQQTTAGDILKAIFPSGSITGAPKIRSMEIIREVENAPRGISMGAIGYFAFDGRIDLNVAIRTISFKDSVATLNVGGGIVADSDPAEEYEESLLKAKALLAALRNFEF
jgi:para-aminobenzoate synthetase component 1